MLIQIKDEAALKANDIFYTPKTLYRYCHQKKWPAGIFVRQGRKVLLDVEAFRKLIQSS